MRRTKKEKEEQSSENNSNFFQLFHSISSLLSTLSILPIPNYKLPKAICNAIISDRQVLTLPLLLVQLWFDFAKWKQVAEATWLLSVFQCVPDQTWRFIGGIDIDTISRNSALRSAVAKKFFFPAEHQSALESNTSSIFSAPITGEARSNRFPRYIYIYISRESCRLERIYLSQFGRPQPTPKGVQFYRRSNVTNFLEKFLLGASLFHRWRFSVGRQVLDSSKLRV